MVGAPKAGGQAAVAKDSGKIKVESGWRSCEEIRNPVCFRQLKRAWRGPNKNRSRRNGVWAGKDGRTVSVSLAREVSEKMIVPQAREALSPQGFQLPVLRQPFAGHLLS